MQELLTVQQFADAAGISKQAVYKAMNGKLQPYVQLVENQKMLRRKALIEIYGKKVNQPGNAFQPQGNAPLDAMIAILQDELKAKNEQLAMKDQQIKDLTDLLVAKDRQVENLTSSIDHTTSSLQAAQALHAGTLQQQLQAPESEEKTTGQEKKKGWFPFGRTKERKE